MSTLAVADLGAQTVQFRHQASLYLPSRISMQQGELHVRQRIGMTLGALLTLTFSQRFNVATGVSYIPGYATFSGAGKRIDVGSASHRLSVSSGARYWLLGPGRTLRWEVHTSLSVAFGGHAAYQDLFDASTVSGVLGTTVHWQISRLVSVRVRVQDRLYRTRFGAEDPGRSTSPLKVSFGLDLPFVESAP